MQEKIFVCLILSVVSISCSSVEKLETEPGNSPRSVSESYKPPAFADDDRAARVREVAPAIAKLIEEHARERHIPGVAFGIVVDNELVATAATGFINLEEQIPATSRSAFRIASMTKSFTAMAILKVRDEGKLSLSDPVARYIPEMSALEYPTSDSPVIDIENLLTMTAGFPEDNPWGDRQLDEPDQMLLDLIAKGISFSHPPSLSYEYSNTGFAMLGHIVSLVSGQPFQEYIREQILLPLGMNDTYYEYDKVPRDRLAIGYRWEDEQWKLEPMLHDGAFGAMGGLITTIEDFSKYVSFHLSAWPPRSDPDNGPVKRSTLREMHTPQFARLNANGSDWTGPCASMVGYGFGLSRQTDCHGVWRVSHGGALPGFGSNYTFFPEFGIGLMAFGNLTYTTPWPLEKITELLLGDFGNLPARKLPMSDVLAKRQQQLTQLIQTWDPALEAEILAENFYLDKSRESRMAEVQEILDEAGAIQGMDEIVPENQLRGTFKLNAQNGVIYVFFTLTPEADPKVQALRISFAEREQQ